MEYKANERQLYEIMIQTLRQVKSTSEVKRNIDLRESRTFDDIEEICEEELVQ